jgi:hypothetical protein
MAHDVFISHSAKDKATADAVCAMLESNGIRCWIAPRDVLASMEWGEAIIDAIEQCRIMVLVFTANANASPQIRREVERAVNRGVAILPLRMEDVLPGKSLEYFIGNVHWLDALSPPFEAHLTNLAGAFGARRPGNAAARSETAGERRFRRRGKSSRSCRRARKGASPAPLLECAGMDMGLRDRCGLAARCGLYWRALQFGPGQFGSGPVRFAATHRCAAAEHPRHSRAWRGSASTAGVLSSARSV